MTIYVVNNEKHLPNAPYQLLLQHTSPSEATKAKAFQYHQPIATQPPNAQGHNNQHKTKVPQSSYHSQIPTPQNPYAMPYSTQSDYHKAYANAIPNPVHPTPHPNHPLPNNQEPNHKIDQTKTYPHKPMTSTYTTSISQKIAFYTTKNSLQFSFDKIQ